MATARSLTQNEIDYIIKGIDMEKYKKYMETKDPKLYQQIPVFRMKPEADNAIALQAYTLNMKYLRMQLKNIKLILPSPNDPTVFENLEKFRMMITKKYLKSLIAPGSNVGIQAADALGAPITQMTLNSFHNSGKRVNTTTGIERMKEILHATKNMKARIGKIIFKDIPKTYEETLQYRIKLVDVKINDLIENANSEIMTYDSYIEFMNKSNKSWILNKTFPEYNNEKYKTYVGVYKLNKYKMYTYRITIKEILKSIQLNQQLDIVKIIPSDLYDPYLFIFYDNTESKDHGIASSNAAFMFLSDFVYKKIFNIMIKIPNGIKKLFVSDVNTEVKAPIWAKVSEEKRKGMTTANMFYAETEGINLLTVLGLPYVDSTKTHSNDPQQIKEVLGIEAARYSICDEIEYILKEAAEISNRHLLLLVDYMTYMGNITPISIIGSSSKDEGTLLAASRVKATETFSAAAIENVFDVKTPTLEIALGKLANVGTKTMEVIVDKHFDYSCPVPRYPKNISFSKSPSVIEDENPDYVEYDKVEDNVYDETNQVTMVKPLESTKPKIFISENKGYDIEKLLEILKSLNYK